MIVTTTNTIEGRRITRYLGVVTGEAIMGANVFRDLFAGIRDIIGGRSAAYEKELRAARDLALGELQQAAEDLGAFEEDAIDEAEALAAATATVEQTSAPFKRIFTGKHLRNTVVLSLAWLLNWFAIQTFSVLGTTVLEKGKGIDASSTLILVVLSNLVAVAGYLAHGWAGDRFGRRNTIAVGWLLSGLFFGAMLLGPSSQIFVLVTYMMGLFFLLGPYAAIMFFQAECFDTDCRATGSAFIGAMSQPGAIISGFILTGLTAASVGYSTAALWVGALGAIASAVIVLGARKVADTPPQAGVPAGPTTTAGAQA